MKKALSLLVLTAAAGLIAAGWRDIIRFIKIKQISMGEGRPGNVPARGSIAYPQDPGAGALDGTGDFDSAWHGGPAS